jgi:hypothetical protein
MTQPKLTLHGALNLLRRPESRMVQTNINGNRADYHIVPACVRVEPKLAAQIKAHPQIRGGKDSMWPGLDQTWRIGGE